MWKKLVSGLLLVLVIAASGFGLWFYRPWSPYSPAKIASLKDESKLVQTMRSLDDILPFQRLKASPTPRKMHEHFGAPPKFYQWKGSGKQFSDFIEETQTTGLLVLHQGRIKYEKYFLGADETTRFTSWSAAKSFVAVAVLKAIHDGVIDSFDDPAEKYARQFKGSGFGTATIRQLLVMSTGVNFNEDIDDPDSDINRFFFDVLINHSNPDDLLMVYQRNREPMTEFDYISPNSHVLGSILKAAYEKPLNEIIQHSIWTPFGMEGDATWSKHAPSDDGIALAYCCLNARLRDYARFGLQIMDAHVVRPEALDIWPEGFPDAFSIPATNDHRPKDGRRGYSYHFWIPADSQGQTNNAYKADGIYGQYVWIDPQLDIVIAKTSADPQWLDRTQESVVFMRALAQHYAQ